MSLTRAENHVVQHLASDDSRYLRHGKGFFTIDGPGGRVGHLVQRRTVSSLETKGFLRYIDGFYHLTVAGREALK